MTLFIRVFLVWLSGFFRPRLTLLDESSLVLPVLPNDLDVYAHMNNGRYLTSMDLGRMDLIRRSELGRIAERHRWSPIVAGITIQYRRSLKLFDLFTLRTKILCWDAKWFYIEQRLEHKGKTAARAIVRGLFVGRKSVPTARVLRALKFKAPSPSFPEEVEQWTFGLKKIDAQISS